MGYWVGTCLSQEGAERRAEAWEGTEATSPGFIHEVDIGISWACTRMDSKRAISSVMLFSRTPVHMLLGPNSVLCAAPGVNSQLLVLG